MKILSMLGILLFSLSCAERKKTEDNSANILLFLSQTCGTVPVSTTAIGEASRTSLDFSNCNYPSALPGFVVQNISSGLSGSSSASKMASIGTYGKDNEKVNLEVTFRLTTDSSNLDVLALGSGEGINVSGHGFRITKDTIKTLNSQGLEGAFVNKPASVSTPVGTEKTYCLEIHKEGSGAHIFGWTQACSGVTRGTYDFDQEDVAPSPAGGKIALVLNKAILTRLIISNGAIGTSGSLLGN